MLKKFKSIIFCLALLLLFLASSAYYASYYDQLTIRTFFDRNGEFITTLGSKTQGFQIWTKLENIPKEIIEKTIQKEDRWFYFHLGMNPVSMTKALINTIANGKNLRGGSTITQQLAKNLLQTNSDRSLKNKFKEAVISIGLEVRHSKKWILETYLNSIYYGHRCYGITAASRYYFNKGLDELTHDEIDWLVSLPQRPAIGNGKVGTKPDNSSAFLFVEWFNGQINNTPQLPLILRGGVIHTTLDLKLQKKLASALDNIISIRLPDDPLINMGAVVIDVKTGEILAMIGSKDYFDETISGKFNTAVALRQPGSTLKPFTYFAAFSKGYSAETIISDEAANFHAPEEDAENYAPQNFDKLYHGDVSIKEALANSYNIPAVVTLNEIGLSYYHEILRKFGFTSFTKTPSFYGLSITLGSGEVSLLELTNAYAVLARNGIYKSYKAYKTSNVQNNSNPILPNAQIYTSEITRILKDPQARLKTFGTNEDLIIEDHDVAVKTGTSYESRDNWTVGYTPSYAVGVWIGHSDNTPLFGTTGATGAGPLWHAIMEILMEDSKKEIFRLSAPIKIPDSKSLSEQTGEPKQNFSIVSPKPNTRYRVEPNIPNTYQQIKGEVSFKNVPQESLEWYLDGMFLQQTVEPHIWIDPDAGKHILTVVSASGFEQSVVFHVVDGE